MPDTKDIEFREEDLIELTNLCNRNSHGEDREGMTHSSLVRIAKIFSIFLCVATIGEVMKPSEDDLHYNRTDPVTGKEIRTPCTELDLDGENKDGGCAIAVGKHKSAKTTRNAGLIGLGSIIAFFAIHSLWNGFAQPAWRKFKLKFKLKNRLHSALKNGQLDAVIKEALKIQPLPDQEKLMRAAVKQNGRALQFASKKLKADRDVVMAAIQKDGRALQFASKKLKADKEVVLAAVKQDGRALQFASEDLQADKDVDQIAQQETQTRPIRILPTLSKGLNI